MTSGPSPAELQAFNDAIRAQLDRTITLQDLAQASADANPDTDPDPEAELRAVMEAQLNKGQPVTVEAPNNIESGGRTLPDGRPWPPLYDPTQGVGIPKNFEESLLNDFDTAEGQFNRMLRDIARNGRGLSNI